MRGLGPGYKGPAPDSLGFSTLDPVDSPAPADQVSVCPRDCHGVHIFVERGEWAGRVSALAPKRALG